MAVSPENQQRGAQSNLQGDRCLFDMEEAHQMGKYRIEGSQLGAYTIYRRLYHRTLDADSSCISVFHVSIIAVIDYSICQIVRPRISCMLYKPDADLLQSSNVLVVVREAET